MFKQTRVFLLAAVAALSVSACGGGSLGGTPDDGIITGPVPATLTLLASTPQLSSDAATPSKGVTLTAIVKDKDNVVIPDVPVVFSTQDSAELTVPNPAATDNTGRVQATLTTGGDPQNRTITVKATAGTLSKTLTINVIGTTLEFSGPDSTQINAETPYTVLLTDAAGAGIPNITVQVTT
ncbi:MAG: Ig-like domain-containing protein, partial [Longimicrobiales bacterium]